TASADAATGFNSASAVATTITSAGSTNSKYRVTSMGLTMLTVSNNTGMNSSQTIGAPAFQAEIERPLAATFFAARQIANAATSVNTAARTPLLPLNTSAECSSRAEVAGGTQLMPPRCANPYRTAGATMGAVINESLRSLCTASRGAKQ